MMVLWAFKGHGGWHYGMPELCLTSCADVLDVTKDAVYTFLVDFLTEMAGIFSGQKKINLLTQNELEDTDGVLSGS